MEARKLVEPKRYTVEEYFELERRTGQRYEYVAGIVWPVGSPGGGIENFAGGTINHSVICVNTTTALSVALNRAGSSCLTFNGDLKLHIDRAESYYYPDAMVVCGETEEGKHRGHSVTNPVLIVEVLSKTTAEFDRGDKFHLYRKIPSFREYVLIVQDRHVVDVHYRKNPQALWRITRYEGFNAGVKLDSLNLELPMEELYRRVEI